MILCVHAHQPVGNFEHVFREGFERSYRPFFETLSAHPRIKFAAHFSGSLLDWIERENPEFIERIKIMQESGQLEILGGAYYEPIFGAIPPRDLAGQISLMRRKLVRFFGRCPSGAWLTERVWDPELVRPLAEAGVEYTMLDDAHFEKSRVPTPVTGYYRVRGGGDQLDVFASLQNLRYLMPFRPPEETLDFVRSVAAGPKDAIVFADDCEKFGLWPGTHDWVYGQGWLEKFLNLLEADDTIKTSTPSAFRSQHPAKKDVKIPHASYREMMEWSGGRFYNFFDKYPESRYLRDRVWRASESLDRHARRGSFSEDFSHAQEALYKAQCNCTYWHGVFGGLYLHHLRSAVYENLIHVDGILARKEAGPAAAIRPYTLDSGRRWRLSQPELVSFFNPAYGAAMEELDYLPRAVNLMCNLGRRKEAYHAVVSPSPAGGAEADGITAIHAMLGVKETDLASHLYYDRARRLSFMDHFFEAPAGLDDFSRSSYHECGDFLTGCYHGGLNREDGADRLVFARRGSLVLGGRRHPVRLTKTVSMPAEATIAVRYVIQNAGRREASFTFGCEFNFSIGQMLQNGGFLREGVMGWLFHDSWRGIPVALSVSQASGLLAAPVETVSESEGGLEKTYQQLAVMMQKSFVLRPGEAAEYQISLKVG